MIADNFYPNDFNMFCTKKKLFGSFAPTPSPRHHHGHPGGLQLPPDHQLQSFLALSKTNAPIFFLHYTLAIDELYHKILLVSKNQSLNGLSLIYQIETFSFLWMMFSQKLEICPSGFYFGVNPVFNTC